VRLQFRTADPYNDTAVLPPLAAHSDDDNTDDVVMPPPAVDRTMFPTPSVLAMVSTPSAMIDDTTIVPESSVTTRRAMVQDPWAPVDGYTMVPQPPVPDEQSGNDTPTRYRESDRL
jgi:hypothetical protein